MTYSTDAMQDLLEFESGIAFDIEFLRQSLTDVETALFFAKLYKLKLEELAELLRLLFPNDEVIAEFTKGDHSYDLQGWDDGEGYENVLVKFTNNPEQKLDATLLTALWEAAELMIADSIQDVGDKLGKYMNTLPTHEARMTFSILNLHNVVRNTVGDYRAVITRRGDERKLKVLVILDDSGSMTQETIETIAADVVALSYKANASLALVSNTCRVFRAGTFSVRDVLDAAEYMGTRYGALAPLFEEDWDEVITIADYDSWGSALQEFAGASGRVGRVTDVSLVGKQTFLSQCVGVIADEVRQVMISRNVM